MLTLLRRVMSLPDPHPSTPRVLGMDDFATWHGQSYATAITDGKRPRPTDVLPGHEAGPLAAWLTARPRCGDHLPGPGRRDTVFGRTVAAGRTPALKEQHFHRATARVEGKPGFEQTCWLFVPGLVPSVLAPYLAQDSEAVPDGRPSQAAERSTKDTTSNESSGAVRQKGKASGKARLIQVGRDYITSQEQS
ncbi:hypothetical protein [Streptomyces lydicus]|uniref:hypothetical protein n=1 Tax=Streptomyces lydicus TaxID=47763 RepID=UPI0037D2A681